MPFVLITFIFSYKLPESQVDLNHDNEFNLTLHEIHKDDYVDQQVSRYNSPSDENCQFLYKKFFSKINLVISF